MLPLRTPAFGRTLITEVFPSHLDSCVTASKSDGNERDHDNDIDAKAPKHNSNPASQLSSCQFHGRRVVRSCDKIKRILFHRNHPSYTLTWIPSMDLNTGEQALKKMRHDD